MKILEENCAICDRDNCREKVKIDGGKEGKRDGNGQWLKVFVAELRREEEAARYDGG